MNIAVIAHDNKKDLMVHFCTAYVGVLKKHNLYSIHKIGKFIEEAAALSINTCLSRELGGLQQICSKIAANELDLILFFRDPNNTDEESMRYDNDIIRVCDVHNVPIATNIATAEALIHALDRGDLDWINL